MALKMKISRSQNSQRAEYANGYFKITRIDARLDGGVVDVYYDAFADEEARRWSPDQPVFDECVIAPAPEPDRRVGVVFSGMKSIKLAKFSAVEGEQLAKAYKSLKAIEDFESAEDC